MNTQDLQFVSALGQAVLMAILPVLAAASVRWVIGQVKVETQKLNKDTLNTLLWLADVAVKAAEQAQMSGWITDKKAYAIDICEYWLKSRGIQIDLNALDAVIEAAVFDQFNKDKALPVIEQAKG